MSVLRATLDDLPMIRHVVESAFSADEKDLINQLVESLIDSEDGVVLISRVDPEVLGLIGFSRATLNEGSDSSVWVLAPLAVHENHRGHGIARALVEHGLQELRDRGAEVVCTYGDPGLYSRWGFDASDAKGLEPPHPLGDPAGWLALTLVSGPPRAQGKISVVPALEPAALWE